MNENESDTEADTDIIIIGELGRPLDSDEISVLKLPPKFSVYEKLNDVDFDVEKEMCFTKYRWAKRDECETANESNENEEITEEEKEIIDEISAETRQVYDPVKNSLDMRKRRTTDLKENAKIYLPKPLPVKEEAKIEVRRERYNQIFKTYKEEN